MLFRNYFRVYYGSRLNLWVILCTFFFFCAPERKGSEN